MRKISCDQLPWIEKGSSSGKFHAYCRDVSLALGGKQNLGERFGGHPFDVQIRRVPAGKTICPHFHAHVAVSEFFLVQSGTGIARSSQGSTPVRAGDFIFYPPGEAHQFTADDIEGNELIVLVVADNPDFDACFYPDDGAWKGIARGRLFDMVVPTAGGTGAELMREIFSSTSKSAVFDARPRNLADLPWDEYASPKGKFRGASKELSIALGAKRNTPAGLGGHTFDVEYGRYDARQSACPYHSHTAQTEFYLITEGVATMRTADGLSELRTGDAVICAPHEAHQLRNDSDAPMHYLCIADNPSADSWHYPDSNKYGIRTPRKIFRASDVDYWDGEE